MAKPPPQLPLENPKQPRRQREDPSLHQTVVALRQAGHRVYRAGPHHATLDGRRIANAQLPRPNRN